MLTGKPVKMYFRCMVAKASWFSKKSESAKLPPGEAYAVFERIEEAGRNFKAAQDELEKAVMAGDAVGMTYADIAWQLGISRQSAREYVERRRLKG